MREKAQALVTLLQEPPTHRAYTEGDWKRCGYCHEPIENEVFNHKHADSCRWLALGKIASELEAALSSTPGEPSDEPGPGVAEYTAFQQQAAAALSARPPQQEPRRVQLMAFVQQWKDRTPEAELGTDYIEGKRFCATELEAYLLAGGPPLKEETTQSMEEDAAIVLFNIMREIKGAGVPAVAGGTYYQGYQAALTDIYTRIREIRMELCRIEVPVSDTSAGENDDGG